MYLRSPLRYVLYARRHAMSEEDGADGAGGHREKKAGMSTCRARSSATSKGEVKGTVDLFASLPRDVFLDVLLPMLSTGERRPRGGGGVESVPPRGGDCTRALYVSFGYEVLDRSCLYK